MLGFSTWVYALSEDEDTELSITTDVPHESCIAHIETGLTSLLSPQDEQWGLYRVEGRDGYPNLMFTSFTYFQEQMDKVNPTALRKFTKKPGWDTTPPGTLVMIQEWDQS